MNFVKGFYLLLSVLLTGCIGSGNEAGVFFSEHTIPDHYLVLTTETHEEIGSPSSIVAVSDGFLIYDFRGKQILKYDPGFRLQFTFGSEGEGPGEFQTVTHIREFEDVYMIYDGSGAKHILFNKEGAFVREIGIEREGFSTALEAISPGHYYAPANGREGALLRFIDQEAGSIAYFGQAVGEETDGVDFNEVRQSILAGRVPAAFQNQVALSSNASGLFVIQQATALLQKYTHDLEPAWEISLEIPAVNGVFEEFIERNKRMMDRGQIVLLWYANYMEAGEEGVAVLLNTTEDHPVTMVWVPNDGREAAVITYPGFESKPTFFTISGTASQIYFVDSSGGEIYAAEWPVE